MHKCRASLRTPRQSPPLLVPLVPCRVHMPWRHSLASALLGCVTPGSPALTLNSLCCRRLAASAGSSCDSSTSLRCFRRFLRAGPSAAAPFCAGCSAWSGAGPFCALGFPASPTTAGSAVAAPPSAPAEPFSTSLQKKYFRRKNVVNSKWSGQGESRWVWNFGSLPQPARRGAASKVITQL